MNFPLRIGLLMACLAGWVISCKSNKPPAALPILGPIQIVDGDTLRHRIAPFRLQNQDSLWVSAQDLRGSVYVANFFFASCPSICPTTMRALRRIHERYAEKGLWILSHTVDPKRDSIPALKAYAFALGMHKPDKWHLLTGPDSVLYSLATHSYLSSAQSDKEAPGGFVHSNLFLLVDGEGHVRGAYDGLSALEVEALMTAIPHLLTP